ncbi:Clp protease ClpP [Lysinibacillus sphaericus]|uniref:ATP-dependent Clp protease proteolytic subunit n=1 Tax=Lysinibacillus sphaericus TaxID=1421 RepID=A0A544U7D1_LYSSH|nr:head maturation protease, ClpP-related [Lysinibacillus sp. SDF0037]TQR26849.1 Clp protease ClpP [Lysinibacillus sp. SDF0037]
MKVKRLFNYKNAQFDDELKNVPHNFAVKHDEEAKTSELTIYGVIGESWWNEKWTSAIDVDNALKEAGTNNLVIRLNSPGGSAFDGIAIYNRLMNYKKENDAKITIHVDGWACSAASVIAMAADELIMGLGAMIMIHEASSGVWGAKGDFRSEADLLEELEEGIIDIYMTKATVDREAIREKVDAETWFGASKAIEIGFATSATTSTVEDNKDKEIANLKNQMQDMKNQIENLTNQQKQEPTPEPVQPTNKRKGFLF